MKRVDKVWKCVVYEKVCKWQRGKQRWKRKEWGSFAEIGLGGSVERGDMGYRGNQCWKRVAWNAEMSNVRRGCRECRSEQQQKWVAGGAVIEEG